MDGVGRWADNIYIEKFWRTIKQEQIYINPTSNIAELRHQIEQYIYFYNYQRPRQSVHYNTPNQVYCGESEADKVIYYSNRLKDTGKSSLRQNIEKEFHENLRGV